MGSRIMHLLIAQEEGSRIGVSDLPRFLLGGIAPDAHHLMGVAKDPSHFLRWDEQSKRKRVDAGWFADKYEQHREDSYYLGYLTHLIADDVWLTTLFAKYIFPLSQAERAPVLPAYYQDFRLLNGKLIEHFQAHELLNELMAADEGIELDEVSFDAVLLLKEEVRQDYRYEASVLEEQLRLFSWDEILTYLERSVDRALTFLESRGLRKAVHF